MRIDLETLCRKVEQAEPTAHCQPLPGNDQAVVTFDNRPDVEVWELRKNMIQNVRFFRTGKYKRNEKSLN